MLCGPSVARSGPDAEDGVAALRPIVPGPGAHGRERALPSKRSRLGGHEAAQIAAAVPLGMVVPTRAVGHVDHGTNHEHGHQDGQLTVRQ